MKKYKALILDLDGTTIPNRFDGMPSRKVTEAIKQAKELIHVGIATSRCLPVAKNIITHLELTDLSIFSGGARICDLSTMEYVYKRPLEDTAAFQVCQVLDSFNLPFYTCINDVDRLYSKDQTVSECFMIYALEVDPQIVEKVIDKLAPITTLSVHRVPDWKANKLSLTITHASATKQHGIVELANRLGIEPAEMIGVGDGYNDFPLLMACGLKIAMGNAVPDLKAIADHIAPSVEDDGVAWVIEKFILTPTP
jgi:HAD superfamily hydrolase (TIGR01484 family)